MKAQVTDLAATKADAFVLGGTLLACPNALNAAHDAGWKPITYMSGTCVSKLLFTLGGDGADGVFSVTPLLDPADPANASQPGDAAVQGAGAEVPAQGRHQPTASSPTAGRPRRCCRRSSRRRRSSTGSSVMEAARTLKGVTGVGLQLPGSKWNTSKDDWFLGETFQLVKYNKAAGHTDRGRPDHRPRRQDGVAVAGVAAEQLTAPATRVDDASSRASMSVTTSRPSRVASQSRLRGVQVASPGRSG